MLSSTSLSALILLCSTSWASDWGYEDTDAWCSSDHEYCCPQYTTQSPIDIDTKSSLNSNCPVSNGLEWALDATATTFTMTNTGHSLSVTPSGGDQSKLTIGDKEFCFSQSHIHWGENPDKGSEHTIDSIAASLEIHFVHYLCELSDVSNAIEEAKTRSGDDAYTLAVVSQLYIDDTSFTDHQSPLLNLFINHASSVQSAGSEFTVATSGLPMTELVRDIISSDPVYFYYKGSLTTPGCYPFVLWNVLRYPMYVSPELLSTLRSSLQDSEGEVITKNYRPTLTNTNPVYLCGGHNSYNGNVSDDGSSSSSSDSGDSGDPDAANVHDDLFGDSDLNIEDEGHYTMDIRFSDFTLMNIWGLFGVLMIANMLCCYLWQKKRNQTQKAHLDQDILP